jgi:periplasmic divalent cation tolerance protein
MSEAGGLLVQTTCGTADEARAIADALIGERLAACVQISAIESIYHWQGTVERAKEWRLDIKTLPRHLAAVEARISELHSYDLPEIIAHPLQGSSAYLAWIAEQVA